MSVGSIILRYCPPEGGLVTCLSGTYLSCIHVEQVCLFTLPLHFPCSLLTLEMVGSTISLIGERIRQSTGVVYQLIQSQPAGCQSFNSINAIDQVSQNGKLELNGVRLIFRVKIQKFRHSLIGETPLNFMHTPMTKGTYPSSYFYCSEETISHSCIAFGGIFLLPSKVPTILIWMEIQSPNPSQPIQINNWFGV